MVPVSTRGKVALLSPGHFGVQFTFEQEAHDLMRYAQALASHDIAPGELVKLFEHALRACVREREKRKFAACVRAPRIAKRGAKPSANPRYVPAPVRREVSMRDGGRCTFVSASGHRCEACERLEFDHVTLRAHGGESTPPNMRLRCRAHNQLTAEQVLGRDHMAGARERSERRAAEARRSRARAHDRVHAAKPPRVPPTTAELAIAQAPAREVARVAEAADAVAARSRPGSVVASRPPTPFATAPPSRPRP